MVTKATIFYAVRFSNHELKILFNFHSLKHTHATIPLENSANIKDIQHRLGHSTLSTMMDTYSRVTKKMNLDIVIEKAVK